MSLTNFEPMPTKTLTFIFVVENSAAMQNTKLETVNTALENYIALLQYYAATKTQAQIKVALLAFSGKAMWITEKPVPVEQYVWSPLAENTENDFVCFSSVFMELNQKLAKNAFMNSAAGALPPVIVLFSTSPCREDSFTDEALQSLSKNNWDKNALKLAFAIGKTAERELLEKWTGVPELTLAVKNPQSLLEYSNIAGRLCTNIAINSGISNGETSGENTVFRRTKLKAALDEILKAPLSVPVPEKIITEAAEIPAAVLSVLPSEPTGICTEAVNYKKNTAKNYVSINPSHIDERVGGKKFFITRKYDGELAVLSWNGNSLIAANSSGKLFKEFPCITQAALQLKKSGVKSFVFAAELYCNESNGRSRVSDCLSAVVKNNGVLRLAPFDIISIEDKPCRNIQYDEIYKKLQGIFGDNEYCKPVRYTEADSKTEIKNIFSEWVEKENSEGLIVRSELPVVYKIKPRITVDAVVAGFSESSDIKGQVRTLLYALRNEQGKYQIIGRTGNGLTNEQKTELYSKLMSMKVSSNYLEIDSNRLAFHIIRPEIVVELSIGDVITEVTSGSIKNPILEYEGNMFKQTGISAGFSFISAVIERFRDDKTNETRHVSLAQINECVQLNTDDKSNLNEKMPESKILRREVWSKGSAVIKLLMWKTNKEKFGFPAYSFSWTTFNPGVLESFKVDMRISNSEQQINQLAEQFIVKNIKSGWIKV